MLSNVSTLSCFWHSSPVSHDPVKTSQTRHGCCICQRWGQCDFTLLPWKPSDNALLLVQTNYRRQTWAPVYDLQIWQSHQNLPFLGGEPSFHSAAEGRDKSSAHLWCPPLGFSHVLLRKLTHQHGWIRWRSLVKRQRYSTFFSIGFDSAIGLCPK